MPRRLDSILGNSQKLDGGAMFGNAPRAMWEQWSPPDEHNRIDLACRALLVREDGGRTILCESGIGAFFEPKLRERFGVQEAHHVLLDNLAARGIQPADIDVVVLSHLHFDHAGGILAAWQEGKEPSLAFPDARYVVGKEAWTRAKDPHPRDRASFIPELPHLLEATGRLEIVDGLHSDTLGPDYRLHRSDGHTPGMLLIEVPSDDGAIVFCADLIPGVAWVRRAITMGYDRFPEQLIDEKTRLLEDLCGRNGRLFFTHDTQCALATLTKDEKGRIVVGETVAELREFAA